MTLKKEPQNLDEVRVLRGRVETVLIYSPPYNSEFSIVVGILNVIPQFLWVQILFYHEEGDTTGIGFRDLTYSYNGIHRFPWNVMFTLIQFLELYVFIGPNRSTRVTVVSQEYSPCVLLSLRLFPLPCDLGLKPYYMYLLPPSSVFGFLLPPTSSTFPFRNFLKRGLRRSSLH